MATYIRTLIWTAWIGLSAVLLYALPLVSAGILCALSGAALHALFKGRRRQFWKNPISLGLLNKRQKYGRSMRVMKAGEGRVDSSNVKRGGAEPGSAPIRVRSPLPDSADTSDVRPATTAMNRGSRRYRQIALNEDVIIAPEDRIRIMPRRLSRKRAAPQKEAVPAKRQREYSQPVYYSESLLHQFIVNALKSQSVNMQVKPYMRPQDMAMRITHIVPRIETRAGKYIEPAEYMDAARKYGIQHKVYRSALQYGLEQGLRDGAIAQIVVIDSSSFENSGFMALLLESLRSGTLQKAGIQLQMSMRDYTRMAPRRLQIMRALAQAGCAFVLSGANPLAAGLDLELYAKTGVRGVVVNAGHMSKALASRDGFKQLLAVRRKLESQSLRFMVDDVHKASLYDSLKRIGVRHMRGDHMDQLRADHAKSVAGKVA